ncbi:hypothetical protein ACFRR7_26095 [Streptomyces sp. NPDC056909]|uniref:hypothetical protein n=1 Tax=Streptomyces sp. NPDC056909 TaxID=3345963 RepID=UPI0036CFABCB
MYVREDAVVPALDTWTQTAQHTLTHCEQRITGYRAALDAGADPRLVAEWINQAQAEKAAAQQDLLAAPAPRTEPLTTEQIERIVTSLGDVKNRLLATPRHPNVNARCTKVSESA